MRGRWRKEIRRVVRKTRAGRPLGEQFRHHAGPAAQHRGRAEGRLGRHLAAVQSGRLGLDDDANDAIRAAGAAGGQCIEHLLEALPHHRAREYAPGVRAGRQVGVERAAGADVGEHQGADERLPAAGDHRVERQRRERRDRGAAQGSAVHPGAAGELEVLGDAAIEPQAPLGMPGIDQRHRIAETEVAFVVEGRGAERRVVPVAGRDAVAAGAQLELVVHRCELELDPGHRQPDHRLAPRVPAGGGRHRPALGRTEARDDQHALPHVLDRHFVEPGPGVPRQHRTAVVQQLQAREEARAQRLVASQMRQQRGEARGRVEVDRRRDLAQRVDRGLHRVGQRLARVDVVRAAAVQRQADVVGAAEGVVPRQPVDEHRRRLQIEGHALHHLLAVAAQHAVREHHALGLADGARGEEHLGDMRGFDRLVGGVHRGAGRRVLQPAEGGGAAAVGARGDELGLRKRRARRRAVGLGVRCEHQARSHALVQEAKPGVVLREQRVGRRHRHIRNADMRAGQRQQLVLEVVLRQDHHRPLSRQAAVQQGLADGAHVLQGLPVAQRVPGADRRATRGTTPEEHPVGRGRRPLRQPIGVAPRVRLQRLLQAHADAAVGVSLDLAVDSPEPHRAVRCIEPGVHTVHVAVSCSMVDVRGLFGAGRKR
jgi:hypothetical protein